MDTMASKWWRASSLCHFVVGVGQDRAEGTLGDGGVGVR